MGLFSSKKKTYVGTSVVRVIDDNNVPNSPKTGLLKAILQDQDIAPNILEEFSGSIGMRVNRMYDQAKKSYPLGLPTKQFGNRGMGREIVEQILVSLEGQPVEIDYSIMCSPNIMHFAWMKLISDFGYDTSTNVVGSMSTSSVTEYLDNIEVVIPNNGAVPYDDTALEIWGLPPNGRITPWKATNTDLGKQVKPPLVNVSSTYSTDYVKVTTGHVVSRPSSPLLPKVVLTKFNLSLPTVDDDADYFHVCYIVGGVRKYWAYRKGEGTYPSLDNLHEEDIKLGSFYPFFYFRYNKTPVTESLNADVYKSTKKLTKVLGIDFDSLRDSVHENPDIADVEQAILAFTVPANTTDPLERRYLYAFFDEMFAAIGTGDSRPVPNATSFMKRFNTASKNAVVIKDAWFTTTLSNSGMAKRRVVGTLGPVGTYDSGFATDFVEVERVDADYGTVSKVRRPYDYHYYRKQISDVLYDEIQVLNLTMQYHVYGSHMTTGDDQGNTLLVPLDRSILEDWSIPEREVLVSKAMHMIFNSRVVVKVKWYQTGLFKAFMVIVMVVITFWTGGASAAGLGAALAAGGTVALAAIWTMIIIPILNNILLSMVLKFFVEQLGAEFAMLVAVVAFAYGAYTQFGDMASTWGDALLETGNGLFKAIGDNYNELISDVAKEMEAFSEYSSDMWDQLEETTKALLGETNSYLSPYVLFGETPTNYYTRTVHSGNIGINCYSAVSNYANLALKLPTLEDTLSTFNSQGEY